MLSITLSAVAIWLSAAGDLLVLHKGDSSLGFYSVEGKLKRKVKLNQHPHEMVMSPDGRFLYITENGTMRIENIAAGGNSVAVVDLTRYKKTATISTGQFRRPHGIDLRDGKLYVTAEAPDQVLQIDPVARRIGATIPGVGRITHMISASPAAPLVFASNSGSSSVSIIDLTNNQVVHVTTGKRPEGSVVSRDGRFCYVVNRDSNTISVIDVARREVSGQIQTGAGPVRIAMTPNGSTLVYALMQDRAIGFADVSSKKEIARVPVAGMPVSLHLSADGTEAYAASEEIDTVHILDVAGRRLLRSFQTPAGYAPDPVMRAR
jgi:YVTN family beta-propeller protein